MQRSWDGKKLTLLRNWIVCASPDWLEQKANTERWRQWDGTERRSQTGTEGGKTGGGNRICISVHTRRSQVPFQVPENQIVHSEKEQRLGELLPLFCHNRLQLTLIFWTTEIIMLYAEHGRPSYHTVIPLSPLTPTQIKPFFQRLPQHSTAPAFPKTLLHATPPSPPTRAQLPTPTTSWPSHQPPQKNHPGLQPGKVVKPCPLHLHSTFALIPKEDSSWPMKNKWICSDSPLAVNASPTIPAAVFSSVFIIN